jgi:hypothetical protein
MQSPDKFDLRANLGATNGKLKEQMTLGHDALGKNETSPCYCLVT